MSNLDEKLFDVLDEESIPELIGHFTPRLIEAIKQVFRDEGWTKLHTAIKLNGGTKGEVVTINDEVYLSGAEWLARFEKEMPTSILVESPELGGMAGVDRQIVMEAARRASGVAE